MMVLFSNTVSFRNLALGLSLSAACLNSYAQTAPATAAPAAPSPVERAHVGDAPDDPGPLAADLSAEIKPKAIDAAMKKVGDWQVRVAEPNFNKQWTFAALYDGSSQPLRLQAIRSTTMPCCISRSAPTGRC